MENNKKGQPRASLMAQLLKNPPATQETQEMQIQSLGREDLLEKEMATHSSVLACRIPGTGEPHGLPSVGSHRSRTQLKRLSSSSSRYTKGFLGGSDGKASACNAGDPVRSLGQEDPLEEASGNPLQYSCLENPMDGGAWWATVHGFAESQTRLSDSTLTLTFEVIQGVPSTISNTQYGGKYECE